MSQTIPELIQHLDDPAVEVRAQAAKTLGEYGADAKEAIPALMKAVQDRFASVRDQAIASLSKINLASTISALISNLEDEDDRVRNGAIRGISTLVDRFDLPPDLQTQVFKALVQAAQNRSWFVRSTVMATIGELGPAEDVMPILIAGLSDEEVDVRQDAAIALQCFGAEAAPAVSQLIDTFWHGIELYATSALGSIGPSAAPAIPRLLEALQKGEEDLRGRAAEAIGEIKSADAVPRLIDFLQTSDPELRQVAAEALQCLGPVAKAAVPALKTALQDPAPEVRANAARALGEIEWDNPAIASVLTALLQDSEPQVRSSAAYALQLMGQTAASAVPALITALQDESDRVSQSAAKALAEIDTPEAKSAIAHYQQRS